jgi:hypothetical protein
MRVYYLVGRWPLCWSGQHYTDMSSGPIGRGLDVVRRLCGLRRWTETGMGTMQRLVRISAVSPQQGFRVLITFTDGSKREVDLEPYLRGPIFEPLRNDRALFMAVQVDPVLRTLVWPNGADIDPDVLYHGWRPAGWPETLVTGTDS